MTANRTAPKIAARDLTAAATRLYGTVVLDLADLTVTPAVYVPAAASFTTVDGVELGLDDGSLVVLVQPGTADDLIREAGTAGAAAQILNRELRAGGAL